MPTVVQNRLNIVINIPPAIVIGVVTKTEFDCETKYVKQNLCRPSLWGSSHKLAWSSGTVSGANNEMMNTSQNGTAIPYVTDAVGCKSNYSFNVKLHPLERLLIMQVHTTILPFLGLDK
jgi:hypothetical protein